MATINECVGHQDCGNNYHFNQSLKFNEYEKNNQYGCCVSYNDGSNSAKRRARHEREYLRKRPCFQKRKRSYSRRQKAESGVIFDVYGEIPTTKPVFEAEHYLGSDITGKWNTFIQNYTHEYDVTIGFTDSSVEILKPSIYKAVNKVNKYYKKALKKEEVSREVATFNMGHILDCANVMCFDDNSKSFEEALKSADEPEEIIALFNQVTLRKL